MQMLKWVVACGAMLIAGVGQVHAGIINVGVLQGLNPDIRTNLQNAGMNATTLSITDIENGILNTASFDTFMMGRVYIRTLPVSQSFVDNVSAFVNAGGGLVTEWDGAALLWSGYHSTYRYDSSYPQAQLFTGTIGAGQALQTGTNIHKIVDHPILADLPTNFSAHGGTEFLYTSYGYDDVNEIEILATFQGNGTTNFPDQAFPAVFVGRSLNVVGIPFDFQDNPNDPNLKKLYTNAVTWSATNATATLPEPSSLALFGLGAAGMAVAVFRRRPQKPIA